jgi:hypothetical protein
MDIHVPNFWGYVAVMLKWEVEEDRILCSLLKDDPS